MPTSNKTDSFSILDLFYVKIKFLNERHCSKKRSLIKIRYKIGKSICAGDESVVRLLLLLDLTVVDIFFILVRIESVVVVGCNLFITQKI